MDGKSTAEQEKSMESLNKQMVEMWAHTERWYRKILTPDLLFSPAVKFWFKQTQTYRAILTRDTV